MDRAETSKISETKLREALAAIVAAETACRDEWKSWTATLPKKLNGAQRERSAYLRGRLAGLHQAHREFEMRSPIEFHTS
jgi:hypothetical protein